MKTAMFFENRQTKLSSRSRQWSAWEEGLDGYPFGMIMPARSTNTESYRFGFQNQEKETEITNNPTHYSAEYWMYDSRTGRRWNLDPKPNPSISYYATFANNPIINIDILGDTLTASAEKWATKMEIEVGKQLKKADPESNRAKDLNAALQELDVLRTSTQMYDVQMYNKDGISGEVINKGVISYDTEKNLFVIGLNENWNNRAGIGDFAHELKHAYQFEMGQLSFTADGKSGGKLYDYTDEVEAHERGGRFGAERTPDRSYLKLPREERSINSMYYQNNKYIEYIQNKYKDNIFRMNGKTFILNNK